ncbi:Murein DD-endopeptidase MepM/ murein hydrolase activator NlpD [Sphingomonas antarctica]|uniref:M23 family metallopeptidase n=1 Tax=Sphingomonas antarctica TaxID=2040274 RepID=UPI0039E89285
MILTKLVSRVLTIVALAITAPAIAGGQGGPYEAAGVVTMSSQSATQQDGQFRSLFQSWKRLDGPAAGVAIPSQRPVDITTTSSGYGVRSDPFRGTAAFHAGVDMPGPMGTAIYATADGIVGRAGWASGYGNLVELQHGQGISTRYGHLSAILVQPGQRVARGQLIARMGSTGRSTGCHLHYEVRLEGHAVNPVPFLQAANYLTIMDAAKEKPVAYKEDLGGE